MEARGEDWRWETMVDSVVWMCRAWCSLYDCGGDREGWLPWRACQERQIVTGQMRYWSIKWISHYEIGDNAVVK
jgi:hypothetical protein